VSGRQPSCICNIGFCPLTLWSRRRLGELQCSALHRHDLTGVLSTCLQKTGGLGFERLLYVHVVKKPSRNTLKWVITLPWRFAGSTTGCTLRPVCGKKPGGFVLKILFMGKGTLSVKPPRKSKAKLQGRSGRAQRDQALQAQSEAGGLLLPMAMPYHRAVQLRC